MESSEFHVFVRSWSAWAPGIPDLRAWQSWAANPLRIEGSELPPLKPVSAILRRRLSKSARVAFEVALACVPASELSAVDLVFASRHGESETTERLLESVEKRDKLSPNDFSLSVHNSAVGLFSIFAKNRNSTQAIAARHETFAAALLDSILKLKADGERDLLLVYSDERVPEVFSSNADDIFPLHGIALLLSSRSSGKSNESRIALRYTNFVDDSDKRVIPQALEFLRWMLGPGGDLALRLGGGSLVLSGNGADPFDTWQVANHNI